MSKSKQASSLEKLLSVVDLTSNKHFMSNAYSYISKWVYIGLASNYTQASDALLLRERHDILVQVAALLSYNNALVVVVQDTERAVRICAAVPRTLAMSFAASVRDIPDLQRVRYHEVLDSEGPGK
jgi:hypothetical protein